MTIFRGIKKNVKPTLIPDMISQNKKCSEIRFNIFIFSMVFFFDAQLI